MAICSSSVLADTNTQESEILTTYQSDNVDIVYDNYDDEIQLLVACDEKGCYTTRNGSYTNSVYRYAQANYTNNLYNSYGNPCTGLDKDGNTINYTIANAGCAVTSMAMIINDMAGYTTGVITPDEVNETVYYSCNFNPTYYEQAYGDIITLDESRAGSISYNKQRIISLLAPLIDSNTLGIICGQYKTSETTRTHYVVVNGYTYVDRYYDDGDVVRIYTGLSIVDPGGNNLNFNNFISTYSTITDYAVFSKS